MRTVLLALTLLLSSVSHAWWSDKWPDRLPITLDTSKAGANLTENQKDATVLVRLHSGNFQDFFALKDNLGDLRFIAGDDKTPLQFHVDSFDIINQFIYVWVKIPQLTAGVNSDRIWMYYGNGDATPAQNSAKSYDIDTSVVYHFKAGQAVPQDVSTNKVNAAAATATVVKNSQIGAGLQFAQGQSVSIPASPALMMQANQGATISFWVKPKGPQADALLFDQHGDNADLAIGIDQSAIYARLQLPGGTIVQTDKIPAVQVDTWQHVALVLAPTKMSLYVDGKEVANVPAQLQNFGGAITLGNDGQGAHSFVGDMDELRIDHIARSAAWIEMTAANQGIGNKLIGVQQAEQLGSGGGSSFWKVIIGSQDNAGWVIIGSLAVMAAISWMVMIGKAFYIRAVNKDNVHFLDQYRALGARDPALLDHEDSAEDKELDDSPVAQALFGKHDHFQSSPIYRVYHRGIQEAHSRLGTSVGARAAGLTPGAIAAIRATLDTQVVVEQQRLNSKMVLLTIGIAGGPFIGLLGTVIGVMITFAAIAASGDVNISAIAPGVAAALAATVMGLMVAIPSLFGYNYLMSQIKSSIADMRVFADEFITRLAEYYGN